MQRDAIDLGRLKVATLFRRYFVPTLLGMVSISAVTVVDGIFVGRGVGSDGIAAINICYAPMLVFTGIGLMAGIGCSVVASIHLAQRKVRAARLNVTQAFLFVTLAAALPMLAMLAAPRPISRLLGASDHLLPLVAEYMVWYAPALLFQLWTAVGLFVIRLDGAPRLAMWCSVVSAAINVVLDWWFVFPLGMGVRGAAFATMIATVAGGAIVVLYLALGARTLRFCRLKWSRKSLRLSLRNVGYQCRIGSSALLGEATMSVLMFTGNQVFMRYLGDDGVGAFGIACYYAPFVFMIGNAVAQSAQPIISYNFGAGDRRRVRAAGRIALATAVGCGAVVAAAFLLCPRQLVGLFLPADNAAAQLAIAGFPLFAAGFVPFVVNLAAVGYYQSLERVRPATVFALLRGCLLLVPSFVLLPRWLSTSGIWLAMPLSETATLLLIVAFYALRRRAR
ncbi:MATE family efflux transporter [uncultured Alistipes sp.]|uniref:MATE family efflux transporter n=1 Tax=uncultured Alistipes sp. TaxID=538949 RepID=UPI002623087F|nr:MATE family efflux transporter [uncultured Alistipes sp.]